MDNQTQIATQIWMKIREIERLFGSYYYKNFMVHHMKQTTIESFGNEKQEKKQEE